MPTRRSTAVWEGPIADGRGTMTIGAGVWSGPFSVPSRFEDGEGTNPEELLAAAHAGCFSMALSAALTRAGFSPQRISTTAEVTIERVGEAWRITRIHLDTTARVPDADPDTFARLAEEAKTNCPVSVALAGPDITLEARLG